MKEFLMRTTRSYLISQTGKNNTRTYFTTLQWIFINHFIICHFFFVCCYCFLFLFFCLNKAAVDDCKSQLSVTYIITVPHRGKSGWSHGCWATISHLSLCNMSVWRGSQQIAVAHHRRPMPSLLLLKDDDCHFVFKVIDVARSSEKLQLMKNKNTNFMSFNSGLTAWSRHSMYNITLCRYPVQTVSLEGLLLMSWEEQPCFQRCRDGFPNS